MQQGCHVEIAHLGMTLALVLEEIAHGLALLVELGIVLALAVHLHIFRILLHIAGQLVRIVPLLIVVVSALGSYGHACLAFGKVGLEQLIKGILREVQARLEETEVDHTNGVVGKADDLDATLYERRRVTRVGLQERPVPAHVVFGEVPLLCNPRIIVFSTGIISFTPDCNG